MLGTAALIANCDVAPEPETDESVESEVEHRVDGGWHAPKGSVQLGPRPYFLVDNMDDGWLKNKLNSCSEGPFYTTDFSIGHRGACMQFPEHTRESYEAAARMGAGILECDVTFTQDGELVCRHAQCDLHTTTNILATELASSCEQPFVPAQYDEDGNLIEAASARCCASDITLEQFKSLCGKMDAADPRARTVEEYLGGTADWRTDLYSTCGEVLSHKESIDLFTKLDRKFTPELKGGDADDIAAVFGSQAEYAQALIDDYEEAGVDASKVWAQSFNLDDVRYWIANAPDFGEQAVFLDGRYSDPEFDENNPHSWSPTMRELADEGVQIIAPPMWMLLKDRNGRIRPSRYARRARRAGLDIITWTIERSAPLAADGAWYHQTTDDIINNDGDKMQTLHVLAKRVGILGIFSDWPATVTYYANCFGL
ncbi:MAG: glycerophosphodiester phosphodiesterase [Myxococcales bacterium FL481]|nr:MAG: glycerophosphodiester phosphodiesterase [Myxococcales bacterium FL481]